MNKRNLQSKRVLRSVLLVLLLSAVGMTKAFAAYDFSAVCETGQTLYYKVTDATNHYVELTCPGIVGYNGWSGFIKPSGNLILPEDVSYNGDIYIVTSIGDYAFYLCYNLTSIELSNSVTSIGNYAFSCNYHLSSIIIPNSVTSIGDRAFSYCNCPSLSSIEIPNSVTSIGFEAFSHCSNLTIIEIPNSVSSIGWHAFIECTGLEQIIVDSGNAVYDSRENSNAIIITSTNVLVKGCKNTVIPNTVTSIENCAFIDCIGLTSVTIPNSIISIGYSAFYGCTDLASIVSFAEVPPILGDNVFNNVNTNITVYVPCNSTEVYSSINWGGFSNFMGMCAGEITALVYPIGSGFVSGAGSYEGGTHCTLTATPNEGFSFFNWTKDGEMVSNSETYSFHVAGDASFVANFVQGVTINFADSNVKAICVANWDTNGDGELSYTEAAAVTDLGGAFRNNNIITSFNELQYFTGLTSIGSAAFQNCSSLTSVTIPNSVTTIGSSAFFVCSSLTLVTIPNSVTSIGFVAFEECSGLTSITIPNSVTSIGDRAFAFCSGLEQIIVESGNAYYDSRENCNAIIRTSTNTLVTGCKNTVFPNSVTSIGHYAFEGCSGLTTIVIPNSVTYIGVNSFSYCDDLAQISVDSGNTVYDSRDNCNAIIFTSTNSLSIGCKNTVIPNSVTSISAYAFEGCRELTAITIPNSVTSIGYNAFCNCSGLTGSLNIPNSVTTIGSQAFSGCIGFTGNLTIPNSVATIGSIAFQACHFTGSLIIPNSITTIEEYTFNMCWNFTSVEIPETVSFIGEGAFACWYGLQSMIVLANIPPTLDNGAFSNVNKSIPVYVPVGTIAAYQAAPGWSEFTNYHEIESSYTITASANPAESGSVAGGGTYTEGTICTLTATANEGYSFVNWTENNEVVSTNANYSFTVSENRNLVANFALSGTITNHWTPESANYSEIMAMYSVIQIDGVEQYSNMLEVGVFCGDECRGSAIASEFYLTHRYLAILDVFGENGHQLTFKLYDHSIGQELNLTSPATVTFEVNGYGNPVEPYVLNFTSTITHSQALNSGWNWWSTYIEQNGIDGLGMLENSIGSAGVRIQGRNGTIDQFEYQGSSYWYGSLTSIENEQMYKIRTNATCNAVMVGNMALPANHPITINGGWNWIGFPCNQSVSVNDAMSGFTPVANDVIKGRNGSTTYVSYGSNSLWYGTLNTLEPGQGYMYKSNSNTSKTLVFQMGRGEETVTDVTEENSFFTPNTDDFSDNMLVTAVIKIDGQELRSEDYEIAAYVGNECRGSVRLMYVEPFDRYVAFLLVFGEAEEEIHFVLTDGNDVVWSDDFLTYTDDGLEGTVTEPAILHFGTLGLNDNEHDFVNIFPNPSNGIFNIEGNGLRKIEVVNAFGQTVLLREVENSLMQIDLGDKAAGVYLLRVITNNGITTKQLIKE